MPTSSQAFAVVAHALGNVDPEDGGAVDSFYEHAFLVYPEAVRELIADFVISQTGVPSTEDLAALREAVKGLHDQDVLIMATMESVSTLVSIIGREADEKKSDTPMSARSGGSSHALHE